MTLHAIERLAERFPRCDPALAFKQITDSVAAGVGRVATPVHGSGIYEAMLHTHEVAFAVVSDDGGIVTVLTEGMKVSTSTGLITLIRKGIPSGIHQLDAAAYHADPCRFPSLSSTLAKKMLAQSPLHAWVDCARLNPGWEPTEKKTFDIGRAAHRAVLGKGDDFAAIPDEMLSSNGTTGTKAAKEFMEDCRARGITPLKSGEVEQIAAIEELVRDKLIAFGINFDPAHSEVAAIAEIGGIWCRAMIDNAPLDSAYLYDLKTCESAAPEACMRAVMNYGYDIQAAHYRETWRAATGEERNFRFVFVEKSAPYEVCVVELGEDTLSMASKKIARAREMWANCLKANDWPGYPIGIQRIELPEWFHEKWNDRQSVEQDFKARTGRDVLEMARQWQAPAAAAE